MITKVRDLATQFTNGLYNSLIHNSLCAMHHSWFYEKKRCASVFALWCKDFKFVRLLVNLAWDKILMGWCFEGCKQKNPVLIFTHVFRCVAAEEKLPACSAAVLLSGPVGSNSLCFLNLTRHHRLSGTKLHMSLEEVWPQHLVDGITVSFLCIRACLKMRGKY